jgi:hypothetical protein
MDCAAVIFWLGFDVWSNSVLADAIAPITHPLQKTQGTGTQVVVSLNDDISPAAKAAFQPMQLSQR